jgi:hypothetical protein
LIEYGAGVGEQGGKDDGLVGEAQQLLGADLGPVAGDSVAGAVDQVGRADGDEEGGGDATGVRKGARAQQPVAEVLESVVHALARVAGVGNGCPLGGDVGAGPGQRGQDGGQFGSGGAGEPELPGVGAVAGGAEAEVAPVGVQLVVGFGAVGVDRVDDLLGEAGQLMGAEGGSVVGQQLLTGGEVGGIVARSVDVA